MLDLRDFSLNVNTYNLYLNSLKKGKEKIICDIYIYFICIFDNFYFIFFIELILENINNS